MPSGRRRDRARPYTRSGLHVVQRALPYLTERIGDPAVPDHELSAIERGAREWRRAVLDDLGGPEAVSAARRALLDSVTGSVVILGALDAFLFDLATAQGLASRKHRRAFPIVADRMRVADSLTRQLAALGLDRVKGPAQSLDSYIEQRYGRQEPQNGAHGAEDDPEATREEEPASEARQRPAREPVPAEPGENEHAP